MTTRDDAAHEASQWDERYGGGTGPIWSGRPNGALVAEVAGLPPGRALDVGCGEGADAVWLAQRGWDVTGLDVSRVALERAAAHAGEVGVTIAWRAARLVDAAGDLGVFDLVSAQYPALLRTAGHDAERALLAAVAPGGVLLVVHHDMRDAHHEGHEPCFDPADYVTPADVAALLDEHWTVEVDELRDREISGGAGAHHARDVVLRARRE